MKYVALPVLAFALAQPASAGARLPVRIGTHGQPELDACLSIGRSTSQVAVRLAPREQAAVSVILRKGQEVFLCGPSADGAERRRSGQTGPGLRRIPSGAEAHAVYRAMSLRLGSGPAHSSCGRLSPNSSSRPTPLRGAA
jgi:hypothetical protein